MKKTTVNTIVKIILCYVVCFIFYLIYCFTSKQPLDISWKGELIILAGTIILYLAESAWKRRKNGNT